MRYYEFDLLIGTELASAYLFGYALDDDDIMQEVEKVTTKMVLLLDQIAIKKDQIESFSHVNGRPVVD